MKVALALERYEPDRGGLERWTSLWAEWLAERGHEVHVAAFGFAAGCEKETFIAHPLAYQASRLKRAAVMETFLKSLGADIVHDIGVGWYFDILQPQGGSKRANDLQDMRSRSPMGKFKSRFHPSELRRRKEIRVLEKRQYAPGSGTIVAVSQLVKTHMERYHGVDPSRIRVIHNGVNTGKFSPEDREASRARIRRDLGFSAEVLFLFVANNFRLKGLSTVLKAMGLLKRRGRPSHLAVIGRGAIEAYRKDAARWGVSDQVSFLGFIKEPEIYYRASDVFVYPSFYDTCSLVALEAWSSGLPVITTSFNGASELMTPRDHGFLLQDPADARQLAEFMEVFFDPALRARMSEKARSLALGLSLENNFTVLERLCEEIRRTSPRTKTPMPRGIRCGH